MRLGNEESIYYLVNVGKIRRIKDRYMEVNVLLRGSKNRFWKRMRREK